MLFKANNPLITGIRVEKLFHEFTYEIYPTSALATERTNLLLLYGNNGSGKTTILNILYHLLDPEPYGGHRTFVGSTPFQIFEVQTSLGYRISAIRPPGQFTGMYELKVCRDDGEIDETYVWEPGRTKREDTHDEATYKRI